MNKTATIISEGCLQDMYLQKGPPKNSLILQILNYQMSQYNPKEIILRVSDKESFLDCILFGPYTIRNSRIVSDQLSTSTQSYKRYDLVRVVDFFCKIDTSKMCRLKIIIRKLQEAGSSGSQVIGRPEQISQFIESIQSIQHSKHASFSDNTKYTNCGTEQTPIKIEEQADQPQQYFQNNRTTNLPNSQIGSSGKIQNNQSKQQQSLVLADIMNNKQGYFIGRLLRMKFGCKQAKDGPMSFLYIGLVDSAGSMVRIHLAGRSAIKQSKQLKKGRCYYMKGLELFQGDKIKGGPQIRLKEKEYKIQQIQNQIIKAKYLHSYYRWQHENEWNQSEMVDVIGVVEDIQQKITYRNANTFQEQRDVVRLVIKNAFKTVRISFWADHINIINNLRLIRRQPILIQDIKKKKTIFLDFISESNIILLDDEPQLKQKFSSYFAPIEDLPQPTNIQQLKHVVQAEPYSTKQRSLTLTLTSLNYRYIIYKMCNECKRKVERVLLNCIDCNKSDFSYKYNCTVEFTDVSGSISCFAFDNIGQKIFNRSANDFSRLQETEIRQICQLLTDKQYRVAIQNKNNRLVLRTFQPCPHQVERYEKLQSRVDQNIDEIPVPMPKVKMPQ